MASDEKIPTIKLSNGVEMPLVGLGTLSCDGDQLKAAVKVAIDNGYRHIDTARIYGNEAAIGEALQECLATGKVKREELFITTKLVHSKMGVADVRPSLEESLERLKLVYIDLYLIHVPFGYKNRGKDILLPKDGIGKDEYEHYDMVETWKEMEKLVDSGKVRSIGVSNFNSIQLDYVCRNARIQPVTNQVEVHAYFPQYALQDFCRTRRITVTAYAPIGAPARAAVYTREGDRVLLEETIVKNVSHKYRKTPAQVLLRDLIQRGIAVIPKSEIPGRIKENMQIFDFELAQEDVVAIAELNVINRRFFDMLWVAEGHPDYPFTAAY